jgi:hypothetical protein
MKRIAVVSQAIKSVGYDAASETLHVEFVTLRVHHIRNVYSELRVD